MNNEQLIPNGEQKIVVELTVKEAIALSGVRFNQESKLLAGARRKLKQEIDRQYEIEHDSIPYHVLGL